MADDGIAVEGNNNNSVLIEIRDSLNRLEKITESHLRPAFLREDRLTQAARDQNQRWNPFILICQAIGVVFAVFAFIAGAISTAILVNNNIIHSKHEEGAYIFLAVYCLISVTVLIGVLCYMKKRRYTNRWFF